MESLNKDDSGMSKKNATSYANTIYFDGETGTHGIGSKLAFLRKMQAEIPTPVLKPSL